MYEKKGQTVRETSANFTMQFVSLNEDINTERQKKDKLSIRAKQLTKGQTDRKKKETRKTDVLSG